MVRNIKESLQTIRKRFCGQERVLLRYGKLREWGTYCRSVPGCCGHAPLGCKHTAAPVHCSQKFLFVNGCMLLLDLLLAPLF